MIYTQIDPTYKYDLLARSLAAREMEHFHYDFDRINFEKMLETLPEGPFRTEIEGRLQATREQIANVLHVHSALMSQVDDQEAFAAAIVRTRAA